MQRSKGDFLPDNSKDTVSFESYFVHFLVIFLCCLSVLEWYPCYVEITFKLFVIVLQQFCDCASLASLVR